MQDSDSEKDEEEDEEGGRTAIFKAMAARQ